MVGEEARDEYKSWPHSVVRIIDFDRKEGAKECSNGTGYRKVCGPPKRDRVKGWRGRRRGKKKRKTDRQIGRLLGLTGSGLEVAKFFSNFPPPPPFLIQQLTDLRQVERITRTTRAPHVYPTNLKLCNSWIQMFRVARVRLSRDHPTWYTLEFARISTSFKGWRTNRIRGEFSRCRFDFPSTLRNRRWIFRKYWKMQR